MTLRALALSIGVSVLACSATARPPAPPRLLGPPRFDVDPIRHYRGRLIQTQTVTADGQPVLDENMTLTFVDRVQIEPRATGFAVTEQLSEIAVTGRLSAAEDESTRRLLEGARLGAEFSADLGIVTSTAPSPEVEMMVALMQTEPQLLPLLPHEPVARGASWTHTRTIDLLGGTLEIAIRVTYDDNVPCSAATCARLVTVDTLTPGKGLTGTGSGRGVILVGHDDGRLVSNETSGELDVEIEGTRLTTRYTRRLLRE